MTFPSQIRRPKDRDPRVEEVERGLYVVVDAYDGEYEFPGRPIRREEPIVSSHDELGHSIRPSAR